MLKYIASASLVALAIAVIPVVGAHAALMAVPGNLKAPSAAVQVFQTSASGVQIYVCKAKPDDASAFEWTFKAPEAELQNDSGEKVGKHYAGPTWEGNDGSKVVGEVVERANAVSPGAIPWLLLKAKSHDGAGLFSTVSYIQRLETVGGVAPAEGCDQSAVDTERSVEYTATYAFYYGAAQQ